MPEIDLIRVTIYNFLAIEIKLYKTDFLFSLF
jgi:hypothetical protein